MKGLNCHQIYSGFNLFILFSKIFTFFKFAFILFKQYLFLTFVPKARGLSRELMLQKIQRFFRTSVRHKHTVRKEKNKTITTSENNRHRNKTDYEVKRLVFTQACCCCCCGKCLRFSEGLCLLSSSEHVVRKVK